MALSLILGEAKLTEQQMDTKAVNHRARRPWVIGMIFVAKRKSAKIDDYHGSRKMDCLLLEMAGATFIARGSLPGRESVCVTY